MSTVDKSYTIKYMKVDELAHTHTNIEGGGEVIILNTGAVIGPEAEATRAFHSHLARWFFVYGCAVIALGVFVLIGAVL